MALIVEDGTGKSDADSYESESGTVSRLNNMGFTKLSSMATVALREEVIRRATLLLNAYMYPLVNGAPRISTQSMIFPRYGCTENSGQPIKSNVVPECVKYAAALAAEQIQSGAPEVLYGIKSIRADGMEVSMDSRLSRNASDFKNKFDEASRAIISITMPRVAYW